MASIHKVIIITYAYILIRLIKLFIDFLLSKLCFYSKWNIFHHENVFYKDGSTFQAGASDCVQQNFSCRDLSGRFIFNYVFVVSFICQ